MPDLDHLPLVFDEPEEYTLYCESRQFSDEIRRQYAKRGIAMPDGSFPIPDRDALRRAIRAIGRGTKNSKAALKAHIRKRAKALGATSMLPASWGGSGGQAAATAEKMPMGVAKRNPTGGSKGKPSAKDPDGDGDDDTTASGDTDHDYVLPNGKPGPKAKKKGKKKPMAAELMAEVPLQSFWTLGKNSIPAPTIVAEASNDNGGRMRIRMPFYVGDSITRAPGFSKKLNYPASILSEIVREAKAQITEGRQPLTVYARHAHALSAEHLPIGAIVDVEQQGRIGWATCEIEPTSTGKDVMTLARGRKLNASSLRSGPGRYLLEEKRVNGEDMYVVAGLKLDGLDFAPDGPAMDTFGIEVLAAEARVEPIPPPASTDGETITQEETVGNDAPLTAEGLRASHAELIAEIESPLRERINDLEAQNEALVQEKKRAELDAFVERTCATLTQEQAKALRDYAKATGSRKRVMEKLTEVLIQAREQAPQAATPAPQVTAEQAFVAAFMPQNTGAGHQNVPDTQKPVTAESLDVEANLPV